MIVNDGTIRRAPQDAAGGGRREAGPMLFGGIGVSAASGR